MALLSVWEGQGALLHVYKDPCRFSCVCACVWTHCVSTVQFLQKGVVGAFGEATLLIDKSQHAQFLKGRQADGEKEHRVMMELVIIPLGHIWQLLLQQYTQETARLFTE